MWCRAGGGGQRGGTVSRSGETAQSLETVLHDVRARAMSLVGYGSIFIDIGAPHGSIVGWKQDAIKAHLFGFFVLNCIPIAGRWLKNFHAFNRLIAKAGFDPNK